MSERPKPVGRLERYRDVYFNSDSPERLIFFSDAVFAIAMTLLVLEVKVPQLPDAQVEAGELASALVDEWPHVFAYVLSFLYIALSWLSHHNIWKFIRRNTAQLMWLNILQLMVIAFMPVPTALIAEYGPESRIAPIAYALNAAAIGALHVAVLSSARRSGVLDERMEPELYRMVRQHLTLPPLVFLISCVIALFAPTAAMISWVAMWPLGVIARHRTARRLASLDAEAPAPTT